MPGGWLERLTGSLDLPQDLVLNLARITLIGNLQLVVENHRGLVRYEPGEIVITVPGGQLHVQGEDLQIRVIQQQELSVVGRLEHVWLNQEGAL